MGAAYPRMRRVARLLAGAALGLAAAVHAQDDTTFSGELIEFGSSTRLGSFFPVGKALCEAVNKHRAELLVRCVNVETGGSLFNVNALEDGKLQMSMSIETLARRFHEQRKAGQGGLRLVAMAYSQMTAFVARPGSSVKTLPDLRGKTVWLGPRGSNGYLRSVQILKEAGVIEQATVVDAEAGSAASEFCAGRIDAMLFSVANPADDLQPLTDCGGAPMSLPEAVVRRLADGSSGVSVVRLSAGSVEGQASPLLTLGNRLLILGHERVAAEVVRRFAKAIDEGRAEIGAKTPLIVDFPPPQGADQLSIPVHAGIAAYLRDKPIARLGDR